MNWDDLKIFLAVAEAPSMRVAARQLKVSHTTVSRRIDSLEADLGVKLFDRLPTGFQLTTSGEELMPVARQTDDSLHAFGRSVVGRDSALEGQVCVTIPEMLVTHLFMTIFADFMTEHPAIQIKVEDSFDVFNLSRREADVAIRLSNAPPEHLIGRCLGTLRHAAYATPDYVVEHFSEGPHSPASTARWVGWGTPDDKPNWLARSPFPHLSVVGHFNNISLQADAASRGLGMAYFPCVVGDDTPGLVRITEPESYMKVWLLSHRDLRAAARMRAFRDFVYARKDTIEAKLGGG